MLKSSELQEKRGKLLLVDDEPSVLSSLKRLFFRQYEITLAEGGQAALDILEKESFDMIISDMRMPGMSGAELLKVCNEEYSDMIRVLLTGYSDLDSAIQAVNEGNIYRYISKPWDNDHLRNVVAEALETRDLKNTNIRLNHHIGEQNEELERLNRELQDKYEASTHAVGEAEAKLEKAYATLRQEFDSMVHILVATLELRLGEESGSNQRFAHLASIFSHLVGLNESEVQDVQYAALLRNIGKMPLPDSILAKSVLKMNRSEKLEYAQFPVYGQTSLMLLEPLQNASSIIRSHMELYDGKGFPDRLSGNAIPLASRILRIVTDYVEIQREHNFLGEVQSQQQAKDFIVNSAGKRYDPSLVDIFTEVLQNYNGDFVSNTDRILISDVKAGMTLADNLISPSGAVLLSTGTYLTERHVAKMKILERQFEGHEIYLHVKKSK